MPELAWKSIEAVLVMWLVGTLLWGFTRPRG